MLAVEAAAGMKTSGTLTPRGRGPPAGVKADNCPKTVAAVGMVKLTLGPPLGLFCYCHLCVRRPAEWDPAVEPAGEEVPYPDGEFWPCSSSPSTSFFLLVDPSSDSPPVLSGSCLAPAYLEERRPVGKTTSGLTLLSRIPLRTELVWS